MKPIKAYAYYSPVFESMQIGCISTDPKLVRKYCIKVGTVYGGARSGEDWNACKARGYRIVPVIVKERRLIRGKR